MGTKNIESASCSWGQALEQRFTNEDNLLVIQKEFSGEFCIKEQ